MRIHSLQRVLITFVCVLSFLILRAQEKIITGIISDENGNPLSQATVTAKGTSKHVSTDANGAFRLPVTDGVKTITITYVGMKPQDVSIDGKTNVLVTLRLLDSKLSEIVVIGYGTRRRADVTSSIASLSAKDIKSLPVAGADQAMQGKIAGVTVNNNGGQPGGGVSVRVRGITSVNNNEPLYVVDGVPILTSTSSTAFNVLGGGGGQTSNSILATLNPNDIESIDVLKDASAQAIYGSQGANGVVIINTKRGKTGEGKINYDMYYGWQMLPKKLDMMNLRNFARYQNQITAETGNTPTAEFKDPDVLGNGTDWQDAIFQTGNVQNHQLSFSGGQNKTNYYFSLNYFDQTGIVIGSNFNRYALRFNLDHQVKSWFKAGISSNASKTKQKLTLADEQDGTITQGLIQSPLIPVKNLDGSWGGPSTVGGIQYYQDNPVAKAQLRNLRSGQTKVFGNVYGELILGKHLTIRNELGYDFQLTENMAHQRKGNIGTTPVQSHLIEGRNNSYYWVLRNYINYNQSFKKHNISATAGHEAQYSHYDYTQLERYNLVSDDLEAINAGEANKDAQTLQGGKGEWAMESYFARAGYTYDDRYSLNLSFRADASANFGPNNKWGYFPSASVGWTVTNEKFMKNVKALSYLKLRLGAGAVGNQNAPSGAPNPPYASAVILRTTGFGTGGFIRNVGNPDLKWESVITYNAGVDAGFFDRAIELNVDVYKKVTKDMLLFSSAPRFTGLGTNYNDVLAPVVNAGQMTNTGIDIALTTYNINRKDFTWRTNAIFSHYKNRLDKLINANSSIDGKIVYETILITHTVPGQAVGSFFGLQTDGLFRSQADLNSSYPQFGLPVSQAGTWLGDVRFKDQDGSKTIDDKDVVFIGSPHPKFTYGLTNNFQYKGFDLSIFLQGSYGAKIYNFLRRSLEGMENLYNNQLKDVLNRYTADNTNGSLPRFTASNKNNTAISDRFIESGSYLRIQNISLGYNLPKEFIRKAHFSSARIYVSAQNLYTFTKYKGYDPEIGAFNKSISLMNIDNGHYPNPRSVTVGANIEF